MKEGRGVTLPAVCHKSDPSTLLLCDDYSCEDQDNISIHTRGILMSIENSSVASNRSTTVSSMIARPQWLDEQLYPFQSRFVEIDGNRIHYIDEGTGPILFFLHPGVGWSFIFRDIIKDLRTHFRCVALDLPGFGLSPAAPSYQHTLTGDSRLVERFIQTLGLAEPFDQSGIASQRM